MFIQMCELFAVVSHTGTVEFKSLHIRIIWVMPGWGTDINADVTGQAVSG